MPGPKSKWDIVIPLGIAGLFTVSAVGAGYLLHKANESRSEHCRHNPTSPNCVSNRYSSSDGHYQSKRPNNALTVNNVRHNQ